MNIDELNKYILMLNLKGIELGEYPITRKNKLDGIRYILVKDGDELFAKEYENNKMDTYIDFIAEAKSLNIGKKAIA